MKRQQALVSGRFYDEAARSSPSLIGRLAARPLAERLRRHIFSAPVRFVLWDGSTIELGEPRPALGFYDLHIKSAPTLLRLLWDPAKEFGEAYARSEIE